MDKDQQRYLAALEQRLQQLYLGIRDAGVTDEVEGKAIEAFMAAGLMLRAVTSEQLRQLIDHCHWQVFGMTLGQRRQAEMLDAYQKKNFTAFDQPTWQRQGLKLPDLV